MTTQGTITIYNKRLGADRRDLYWPTKISAASYYEAKGSTHSDGTTSEKLAYKLRVPAAAKAAEGRTYAGEDTWRNMSDEDAAGHWTIARLDLVTIGEPLVDGPATERAIRELAAAAGKDVIIIAEYADNTGRGSPAVRHWRIGGR